MCVPATLGSANGSVSLRPDRPANSMTPLPWVLPLVVLMLCASLPVAVARGADLSDADPAATEEQPAVVTPKPRSEAEQDRIDATALFATGRAHEQRQDYEAALRYYQRAEQASPGTPAILRHIVVLAFNLDRRSEAARYAQLLVEPEPEDAPLLRRLGLELADEGNLQAALTLYRRVAKVQPDDKDKKPSANAVIWWMELGQLYYLTQQYADAAEQFAKVERALANPAEFHLTPQLEKILVGKGDETYRSFGDCYLEAGRLDDAQKAYDEANHHKANAELLAYGRARVAAARHEPAEALRQLELALPGDLSHEGTAPYELLAKVLADLKQQDQLTVQLEKLRAADPDNPSTDAVSGRHLSPGRRRRPGRAALSQLVRRRPPATGNRCLARLHLAAAWPPSAGMNCWSRSAPCWANWETGNRWAKPAKSCWPTMPRSMPCWRWPAKSTMPASVAIRPAPGWRRACCPFIASSMTTPNPISSWPCRPRRPRRWKRCWPGAWI